MFIYLINDNKKTFLFNSKRYYTPCRIQVKGIKEVNQLNLLLKQNKIRNFKIQNYIMVKAKKSIVKQPISGVTSKVVLSRKILGRHSSATLTRLGSIPSLKH